MIHQKESVGGITLRYFAEMNVISFQPDFDLKIAVIRQINA
ncbi:hypothetical protein [Flavobacterium aurantiibacter]|nr:hypothetical protein [Flavobacterium aurantiibacter]